VCLIVSIWLTLYSLSLDLLVDNVCARHRVDLSCTACTTDTVTARHERFPSLRPSEVTSSMCLRTFKTKIKTHLFFSFFPLLTVKWFSCHCHFSLNRIACVGLKPVSGIAQVTIRRKKNSIFVISRPDVYVNSSSDTYIVFGEARVTYHCCFFHKQTGSADSFVLSK